LTGQIVNLYLRLQKKFLKR